MPPLAPSSVENLVVVSPHLDDGVFSLGTTVACVARRGVAVHMLTVLAGDPRSRAPAGRWDRRCGFTTAGRAAEARRVEDLHACALVGATPIWLPFFDEQYPRGADDSTIWRAIVEAVGRADAVLVPGSPLKHQDHRWLSGLFMERGSPSGRLGLYREQPYAALFPMLETTLPGRPAALSASFRDIVRKARACRAYSSQLALFGRLPISRVLAYELRHGGERIAWQDGAGGADDGAPSSLGADTSLDCGR